MILLRPSEANPPRLVGDKEAVSVFRFRGPEKTSCCVASQWTEKEINQFNQVPTTRVKCLALHETPSVSRLHSRLWTVGPLSTHLHVSTDGTVIVLHEMSQLLNTQLDKETVGGLRSRAG